MTCHTKRVLSGLNKIFSIFVEKSKGNGKHFILQVNHDRKCFSLCVTLSYSIRAGQVIFPRFVLVWPG